MLTVRFGTSSLLVGALLSACAGDEPAQGTRSVAAAETGGGTRPVDLNYKEQRKIEALRGLSYETGRTVVTEEAREIVQGYDPVEAEAAYAKGRDLWERNMQLESIATHTRAVLLAPDRAVLYVGLGDALLANRMDSHAEAAYASGLDLDSSSATLHFKYGDTLWRRGALDEAALEWNAASELDERDGEPHVKLAIASYYAKDYPAAWESVHRAEALGASVPIQMRLRLGELMVEPVK